MEQEQLKLRVASNIKKYRKQKKLTQSDLASQTGISFQTIASIESCRVWTSDLNICKIADILEVDVYKLFLPTKDTFIHEEEARKLKEDLYKDIQKIIEKSFQDICKS